MYDKDLKFNEHLLAYCGLYCAQCSFKAAHDENDAKHLVHLPFPFTLSPLSNYNCECCKGYCICGPCKIKPCAMEKHISSCADCAQFPCMLSNAFAADGMPHHKQAVNNLHAIRENGVDTWFEALKPSLQCPCGTKQTWYYTCSCE